MGVGALLRAMSIRALMCKDLHELPSLSPRNVGDTSVQKIMPSSTRSCTGMLAKAASSALYARRTS